MVAKYFAFTRFSLCFTRDDQPYAHIVKIRIILRFFGIVRCKTFEREHASTRDRLLSSYTTVSLINEIGSEMENVRVSKREPFCRRFVAYSRGSNSPRRCSISKQFTAATLAGPVNNGAAVYSETTVRRVRLGFFKIPNRYEMLEFREVNRLCR